MEQDWQTELIAGDWWEGDRHLLASGILLIAACEVGPRIKALRAHTGIPWSLINDTSWYLRQNQVWVDSSFHYHWLTLLFNDEECELAWFLDAMVGAGYLKRQLDNGQPVYANRVVGDYLPVSALGDLPADRSWADWIASTRLQQNRPAWPDPEWFQMRDAGQFQKSNMTGAILCQICHRPIRDHSLDDAHSAAWTSSSKRDNS